MKVASSPLNYKGGDWFEKKVYDVTVVCANCGKEVYDHYVMERIEVGGEGPVCDCTDDYCYTVTIYDEADVFEGKEIEEEYPEYYPIFGFKPDIVHSGQVWIMPESKMPELTWLTMQGIAERWGLEFRKVQSDYNREKFLDEEAKGYIQYSGGTRLFHIDAVRRMYGDPK